MRWWALAGSLTEVAETTFSRFASSGGRKPGILRKFSEPGKLMEFLGNSVQLQGKIITN